MTGRDLIIYILENKLEDQPIYEDGRIIVFITAIEAAVKFDVGLDTIKVWVDNGMLDGIKIGDEIYIPSNAKRPNEGDNNV